MYHSIALTLFRDQQCDLPGIGTLKVISFPADTDFINSRIRPPYSKIEFESSASVKNTDSGLLEVSRLMLSRLDKKETIDLKGIGSFYVDSIGNI